MFKRDINRSVLSDKAFQGNLFAIHWLFNCLLNIYLTNFAASYTFLAFSLRKVTEH